MGTLSPLDVAAGIVIAWSVYQGYRRGFVLTTFDCVIVVAMVLAIWSWAPAIAPELANRLGLAPPHAVQITTVAFLVGLEAIRRLVSSVIRREINGALVEVPGVQYANRLGGTVPGLVEGVAATVLAVAVILALPLSASSQLLGGESGVGRLVVSAANLWATTSRNDAESPDDRPPVARLLTANNDDTVHLAVPFDPGTVGIPDAGMAADFLSMTNLARAQNGEISLIADSDLARVAVEHDFEMVRLAYFSHQSSDGATPADRLRVAGVPFRRMAENIVWAPDLETAFRTIMASPDHRANQLSPDYGRIGVGFVVTNRGVMVTEDFAD